MLLDKALSTFLMQGVDAAGNADAASRIGRTRTAPAANATVERLKFSFASCQQFEQGWYGAYRHIVADSPDLIAFLGARGLK